MKKYFFSRTLGVVLLCLAAGIVFSNSLSANSSWKHTKKEVYSYMDDLSRNPDTPAYCSLHYRVRKLYFSMEPHGSNPVVFLGDSMTDEGDWKKLFPDVNLVNRGIGGDTTLGVLNRIDQVLALAPSKIFLMIGTNDLCYKRSVADTLKNYDQILNILHKNLPQTKIYVESVLPFNDQIFPSRYLRTNENIEELNRGIKKLAEKYEYPYLDLVPFFMDENGRLPENYTVDGLHLNENGYTIWKSRIKNFVKE